MVGPLGYHRPDLPDYSPERAKQVRAAGRYVPSIPSVLRSHNQYCRDDWQMYGGDGPRGMGPAGDGCVCDLAPEGYDDYKG